MLAALAPAAGAAAVTFDDGRHHVIGPDNSLPDGSVIVDDSAGGEFTSIELVAGGKIGTGVSGSVVALGGSRVTISGGRLGGAVSPGGSIAVPDLRGRSNKTVSRGSVYHRLDRLAGIADTSRGRIVGRVEAAGSATVHITGGEILGQMRARESGEITISGGLIGGDLVSTGNAVVVIFGSEFNHPLGDVAESSGTLTGILADGTPLDTRFRRATDARIALSTLSNDPTSASYRIAQLSVGTLGNRTTSVGYLNSATAVVVGGVAGVCPGGVVSSYGFWSFFGPFDVPVRLEVERGSLDPSSVELSWSGQADGFVVYRSSLPNGLESPANEMTTTASCEEVDPNAQSSDLYYYRVLPVSP